MLTACNNVDREIFLNTVRPTTFDALWLGYLLSYTSYDCIFESGYFFYFHSKLNFIL